MTDRQRTLRKSSVVFLILGIVLIAGAVAIRFLVLPSITKLPSDLSQSQKYEGSIQALNPEAFAAGDLANLLGPEVPITADRSLSVDAVDGDTAIVTSKAVLSLPDGSVQNDVHTYSVSRVDFAPVELAEDQMNSLVPEDKKEFFEKHDGIAFSWPMNTPNDGTALYDSVTRTAQSAEFVDSSELDGREVTNYRVDAAGPIQSPTVLAQFAAFPPQLPSALLGGLLQAGLVPEDSRATLESALPTLPEAVDIDFGSSNLIDAAVDQQFGAPLNVDQIQQMYVTIPFNGQDLPVLPLSTVKLHTAPEEIKNAADTLASNGRLLSIIGVWAPIVLTIVGIALIALGLARLQRRPTVEHGGSIPSRSSSGSTVS